MTDPKPKPGQPRKKCKHNQRMESIKNCRQDCFQAKPQEVEEPSTSEIHSEKLESSQLVQSQINVLPENV